MHTALTKTLAVIGNPIEHSMSPLIHGAAIAETGVDFSYVAYRVTDAAEAVRAMRALGIRGFSVTIPHKETVIPHLDRLDESAKGCGSVNTIVNDNGTLTGYTTDGPGAVAALRAGGVDPAEKRVLIVGTGGAARAISFALLSEGVSCIAFQAEVPAQAARLAHDLNAARPGVVVDRLPSPPDLLVNASPVGMHPRTDALPVERSLLRSGMAVFDIVYNPIRTLLLKEAEALGCATIDGAGMFAEQAALQFELFTGRPAPRELMRRTVRDALLSRQG
ncbi:MAG: shikimate dehydrogenase [Candidatus Hydrogenedentota bacterium]